MLLLSPRYKVIVLKVNIITYDKGFPKHSGLSKERAQQKKLESTVCLVKILVGAIRRGIIHCNNFITCVFFRLRKFL